MSIVRNPATSTRKLGSELQISQTSVVKILKDNGLKDYKAEFVQYLQPNDKILRVAFALYWEDQLNVYQNEWEDRIIWTDEAAFSLDGKLNKHNYSLYAYENPHVQLEVLQRSPAVHVWMGLSSQGIIGPFFFTQNVNQFTYLEMLRNNAMPAVMSLQNWEECVWQQDGAPPHWALSVRAYLREQFGENWIGRDGPIAWPPRSPDLTPCDFFLWGHLKDLVFRTMPKTLPDLRQQIVTCSRQITQEMCQNACRSVTNRLRICVNKEGAQVSTTKYE